MNMNLTRRTLLALAGAGALSAGSLRGAAASAQTGTASPFIFPSGAELSWVAPWELYEENFVAAILPNSASLTSSGKGEIVVGYYDSPTSMDDATNALLTFIVQDPSLAPNVAGGEETSVGPGGVAGASTVYRVHSLTSDGEAHGIYIQLVNELELTAFIAPVTVFASEMASAQSSMKLDGVNVLAGVDGATVQKDLGGAAASAGASPVGGGGEYTDQTGFVHVAWTNDWTVVSQDEHGIELTNPAQSVVVGTQGYAFEGRTWQQEAEIVAAEYSEDQGASATISGPEVTESGFSLATDGVYGLRLVQGTPSDDLEMYVNVLAANIEVKGAEAVALLKEVQAAILVNGNPPLKDLDKFINALAV